jgi:hypothetical protein
VLLVASLAGAAVPLFLLLFVGANPRGTFIVITYATGLLLNFIYLLYSEPRGTASKPPSRIVRLFRLWLDAKERELQARANRPTPPS